MIEASQLALAGHVQLQLVELSAIRQPPEPQQIANFLEGRVVGQFVNVDAAIGEHAGIAIDVANSGIRRGNAFQTLWTLRSGGHGYPLQLGCSFLFNL